MTQQASAVDEIMNRTSDDASGESSIPADGEPLARQEKMSGYEDAEHSFDTGLKAWLQVLGAFFLWFNSW
jgi:hypothetical protein